MFEQWDVYEYNDAGDLVRRITYYDEARQVPAHIYNWEYDENGELVLYYGGNEEGKIGFKIEYDPALNTEDSYWDNGYGILYLAERRRYDAKGDLLIENYYNETGEVTLTNVYRYDYKFDSNENVIEKNVYLNDELYITFKREYY